MQVFILVSLCVLNLVLWAVFFAKFKKLFTTDDEIKKARDQFELLVNDINKNTLTNIQLIDDKIEQLTELIAVADKRINLLENNKSLRLSLSGETETVPSRRKSKQDNIASTVIDGDTAFELSLEGKKSTRKIQKELFDDTSKKSKKTVHKVDRNGNAYGDVPVVSPRIYMTDNPIQTKKDFRSEIARLNEAGFTVEEISKKLGKSTTEIQFVIDML